MLFEEPVKCRKKQHEQARYIDLKPVARIEPLSKMRENAFARSKMLIDKRNIVEWEVQTIAFCDPERNEASGRTRKAIFEEVGCICFLNEEHIIIEIDELL